jgi:hypothetical protein
MVLVNAWHSYPKVWNLGHPRLDTLFMGDVVIQEKYDGSQFSFGVIDGELRMRSRGREFTPGAQDKQFNPTVEHVLELSEKYLIDGGWVFRGEVISKPKHNTLTYSRVPEGNFVLYDIETEYNVFMPPEAVTTYAELLGFEPAFRFAVTEEITPKVLDDMLRTTSSLGGPLIEGVVIKNYDQFTREGHVMMGKYVSPEFRESNKANPEYKKSRADFVQSIGVMYNTPVRFAKAVQHLRDAGELLEEPKDIGPLMAELNRDLEEEEADNIKNMLYDKWRKDIMRTASRGFAEWYKTRLAGEQNYGTTTTQGPGDDDSPSDQEVQGSSDPGSH